MATTTTRKTTTTRAATARKAPQDRRAKAAAMPVLAARPGGDCRIESDGRFTFVTETGDEYITDEPADEYLTIGMAEQLTTDEGAGMLAWIQAMFAGDPDAAEALKTVRMKRLAEAFQGVMQDRVGE